MLFSNLPRLSRVGVKLGLVMALLLGLFMVAALISFLHAQNVDRKMRETSDVEESTSAAVYGMEINVIGTGLRVLKYLQTRDAIHRQRVTEESERERVPEPA